MASQTESTVELSSHLRGETPATYRMIERAENVQVTVAIGILTIYTTIAVSDLNYSPTISTILLILSAVSAMFLLLKIFTITSRPFYSNNRFDLLDRLILPTAFVLLLEALSLLTILVILRPPLTYLSNVLLPYIDILNTIPVVEVYAIVFIIAALIGTRPALSYGQLYRRQMSIIDPRVPDYTIPYPSGGKGATFSLILENPTSEDIDGNDVQIEVSSPKGVNADVDDARSVGENKWAPLYPIPAQESLAIPIRISRGETRREVATDTLIVETYYSGTRQNRDMVKIEG